MENSYKRFCVNILNNFVREDIQSALRPLNLFQYITFCPKYCISNSFITPNDNKVKTLSAIVASIFIAAYFYSGYLTIYEASVEQYSFSLRIFICFLETFLTTTGFFINTVVSASQTNNNVDFVLTIQEVHCLLNSEDGFKRYTIRNWLSVIILSAFYLFYMWYTWFINEVSGAFAFCCIIMLIGCDVNLVYAIRLIKLLRDKVDLWNDAVLSSRSTQDEFVYTRLFETYVNIMNSYENYKHSFQVLILHHIVENFIDTLVYIEIFLDSVKFVDNVKEYHDNVATLLMIIMWVTKNTTLQISLSLQSTSFYDAVGRAQETCKIRNVNQSAEENRLYKNIHRLHKATFTKMTVCGLFYVDSLLTIHLVDKLSQHIIVLLQFAIL